MRTSANPRRRDGGRMISLIGVLLNVLLLWVVVLKFEDEFEAADNAALVILFVFIGGTTKFMSHMTAEFVRLPKRRGEPSGAVMRWIPLAMLALPTALFLPAQVDAAAYLTGTGPTATFLPLLNGPSSATTGALTIGHTSITAVWPAKVPLFQPVTLHLPVWGWGTGHAIITSTATAVIDTLGCLFLNVIALPLAGSIARAITRAMRRWRGAQRPASDVWNDIY